MPGPDPNHFISLILSRKRFVAASCHLPERKQSEWTPGRAFGSPSYYESLKVILRGLLGEAVDLQT